MNILVSFVWGIFKKLVTFAIVFTLIVVVWNFYKNKREAKTFISQFSNVEGLSKGAPIYASGIEVGKVIRIFPIGNSNDVAVKGLITAENFPLPRSGVNTRIVTNFKSGGGKALELVENIYDPDFDHIGDKYAFNKEKISFKKAINAPSMKVVLRVMRDTYQMTKDFAIAVMAALSSEESRTYQEHVKTAVGNTITSLEYGTVKQDVKRGIQNLNDEIQDFEESPSKARSIQRAVKDQAMALRNTIESYASLSSSYQE